jgi:hypothetical protein
MSRRSRTITSKGALGLAAAVLGLFAFAAPTLADNALISTSHPELIAAQALGSKAVQACFDKPLVTTFNITDTTFFLQGYTESRKTGTGLDVSSVIPSGSGYCVTVTFSGPGDVRSYSDVTVLSGAVTATAAVGAQVNIQGAVALTGSLFPNTPGATQRPQLVSAAIANAQTAVFTFDEPLAGDVGANGKFGFYTYNAGDTTFHAGGVAGFTQGGTTVTIGFTTADLAVLPNATRFVVQEGAVTDSLGQTNPTGVFGNATSLLNLAPTTGAVSGSGGTIAYHFDFDQPLPAGAQVCPASFALFDSTGVRYSAVLGVAPALSPDRKSVTLDFAANAAGGDPNQITLATVAGDAIDSTSCPIPPSTGHSLNSEGTASLSGATDHPGLTSGPDLIGFSINKSNGNVLFDFDAPVVSTTGALVASAFHVIDGGGNVNSPPNQGGSGLLCPASGPPLISVNPNAPNEVIVGFAIPSCVLGLISGTPSLALVDNAVGVSVDEGAVTSTATGEANPIGTLGVNPPAPPAPAPTTPPAPPVPPVPPLVIPPAVKKPSTGGCVTKRVITIHLLTSVSARLKSATATVNGKAYPVSKKLVVTIPLSKYEKSKTVTLKIKGKPKTGHLAINATRTYHPCTK